MSINLSYRIKLYYSLIKISNIKISPRINLVTNQNLQMQLFLMKMSDLVGLEAGKTNSKIYLFMKVLQEFIG